MTAYAAPSSKPPTGGHRGPCPQQSALCQLSSDIHTLRMPVSLLSLQISLSSPCPIYSSIVMVCVKRHKREIFLNVTACRNDENHYSAQKVIPVIYREPNVEGAFNNVEEDCQLVNKGNKQRINNIYITSQNVKRKLQMFEQGKTCLTDTQCVLVSNTKCKQHFVCLLHKALLIFELFNVCMLFKTINGVFCTIYRSK